jgi:two-component system, response regulator, stage 0 sporulation protein F
LNILIVDDDPLQVQLLVDVFNTDQFSAVGAKSGIDALRLLHSHHFEAILSDIRMPDMNGVELCRNVKNFDPNVYFILMTAYANDDLVLEGMRSGALIVFSKPLDIDNLFGHLTHFNRNKIPQPAG